MNLFQGLVVEMPVARIVFDNPVEFFEFKELANKLGYGQDWPVRMLRDYLESYQESAKVGSGKAALPPKQAGCRISSARQ